MEQALSNAIWVFVLAEPQSTIAQATTTRSRTPAESVTCVFNYGKVKEKKFPYCAKKRDFGIELRAEFTNRANTCEVMQRKGC